ncbi:MAG: ribonuclease P protein component [Gammaproteobacteria bacterium]|nr:ribonuclease P protein component [Gammaproteobacteria bacterium]MBT3861077.1 ribonuclease P protein component [Gammaproteobacteria bacterium]MBT3987713.1 ribonuclease P protein component [Gammaproteobacteria bacterium]MBT4255623.1 ribonuclease P protein component [Gammaproteobacteria bacterium]MBT4582707.1 ribonuclease P protein component [Gammaproteobacteria bacterium]
MADYGFPKTTRLLSAEDYKAVFSNSQFKASCRHILVLAISNDCQHSRLGLVIAKKHISKAVQRNKVKRIIRDSFRLHQDTLAGLDLVVLARKDADKLGNPQLRDKIQKLWKELADKLARANN